MEIKKYVNKYGIIGIVSNYKNSNIDKEYVRDIEVKNIDMALKMVGLDKDIKNKRIDELSLSEEFKIDLVTKLEEDIIVVGDLSKRLNYKDIEYIKKLLLKLNNDYNKKIVVIDKDVEVFINLVKYIYVMDNKEIIYSTNDYYDKELYNYVKMPMIIEFINYVNRDEKRLDEHLDIYELIKDIFRRVS